MAGNRWRIELDQFLKNTHENTYEISLEGIQNRRVSFHVLGANSFTVELDSEASIVRFKKLNNILKSLSDKNLFRGHAR